MVHYECWEFHRPQKDAPDRRMFLWEREDGRNLVCLDYGTACKAGQGHRFEPEPLHPKDGLKLTLKIKLGGACHML